MGLFGMEKKPMVQEAVDSIIGENAKFRGELSSKGSVNINGEFEGKLAAEGEVIISAGSKIAGEMLGGNVIVSGHVDGNITAIHTLEITKTGRVHGDLKGGKIIIEEGSFYHGKVEVKALASEFEEEGEEKEQKQTPGKTPLFQEI